MIPDYPTIIILSIFGVYIYARNLMMERTILVLLHENVSRETSVKAIRVIINTLNEKLTSTFSLFCSTLGTGGGS